MSKKRAIKTDGAKKMSSTRKKPREVLREIVGRSGYSGSQIATMLGYASPPGFLRYMQERYQGDKPIPFNIVKNLLPILRGRGDPPITIEELMAVSDANAVPKSVEAAFVSHVVDDADGLLTVQYRLEAGTFVRKGHKRTLGASRIGTSKEYPTSAQFAVAVIDPVKGHFTAGSQLHCVDPNQFASVNNRMVVIGAETGDGSDIVELRVGKCGTDGTLYGMDGMPIEGEAIGVVIGAYQRI